MHRLYALQQRPFFIKQNSLSYLFLKIGTWLDLIWCIDPIYAGYNGDITKFDTRHRDGTGAGILEITE